MPTCHAHNSKRSTRRDYVLSNGLGLTLIDDFNVVYEHALPTHALLQVRLQRPPPGSAVLQVRLPRPLRTFLPEPLPLPTDEDEAAVSPPRAEQHRLALTQAYACIAEEAENLFPAPRR